MNIQIDKLNIRFKGISEHKAREILSGLGNELVDQLTHQAVSEGSCRQKISELNPSSIKIRRDSHPSTIQKKVAKSIINSFPTMPVGTKTKTINKR